MEYFKPHDKVTKVKLGDQVILRGRIVIVPTPESPKNDCLLRYGSGPLDCVWVSVDAPFYIDRPCNDLHADDVFDAIPKHPNFIKGDRVKSKNSLLTGTFRKYNTEGKCVVKLDCSKDHIVVDAFTSKKGYSLFNDDDLLLLSREWTAPKPVKIKASKTFTGLHDFVTTGHRKFSKGDRVWYSVDDVSGMAGTFIKYYKGDRAAKGTLTPCLFKPDLCYSKGSSKKGYFIVSEWTLSLISKE